MLTSEGRAARLGAALDCPRCDRGELPEGHAAYRCTPRFNEASTPKALLGTHATKAGVWGRIHVVSGRLEYRVHAPSHRVELLTRAGPGIVLPEVEHHVACPARVEFFVEFWRPGEPAS